MDSIRKRSKAKVTVDSASLNVMLGMAYTFVLICHCNIKVSISRKGELMNRVTVKLLVRRHLHKNIIPLCSDCESKSSSTVPPRTRTPSCERVATPGLTYLFFRNCRKFHSSGAQSIYEQQSNHRAFPVPCSLFTGPCFGYPPTPPLFIFKTLQINSPPEKKPRR